METHQLDVLEQRLHVKSFAGTDHHPLDFFPRMQRREFLAEQIDAANINMLALAFAD